MATPKQNVLESVFVLVLPFASLAATANELDNVDVQQVPPTPSKPANHSSAKKPVEDTQSTPPVNQAPEAPKPPKPAPPDTPTSGVIDERPPVDSNAKTDFKKVTKSFGLSIINMASLPMKSPMLDSGKRPWSSWWYPHFEKTLFHSNDESSPLEKYDIFRNDLYFREHKAPPIVSATKFAEDAFDNNSLRWEGLCAAWSLASILVPEPIQNITHSVERGQKLIFTPSDQKALLLKTFEAVSDDALEIYGEKFTGDFDAYLHPDPYPDQFHRFVEIILGKEKRPFIMDHDPGTEIWSVPVYKANYQLSQIPGRTDAVKVRLWLYTAAPLNKDETERQGTKENIREYHYILSGDLDKKKNELHVTDGIWTVGENGVDSRRSHPDYLIDVPNPQKVIRQSFNSAIESQIVDKILQK